MSIGNIGALLGKSIFSCLRNPTGSEIRSVAVQMSNRLEQCKEVVEVMTRKVVEFLNTNMGMVEDNSGQVGNNLEEAWGNLVEEYFSGDNVPALICFSQSQGSRREREFCSRNLRVRDKNEIFFSTSQGSRRERDIFFQSLMF